LFWATDETPSFYLMICDSEEEAKKTLSRLFKDEPMEEQAFLELKERKEKLKTEPDLCEIVSNRSMLLRNLKGFCFFSCIELIGVTIVYDNITEFAILLFNASYESYTATQTAIFTTCLLFGGMVIASLSGLVFNRFQRKPLMSFSFIVFSLCMGYLFYAIEIYDGSGYLNCVYIGLIGIFFQVFLFSGSLVVAGESCDKTFYSMSLGFIKPLTVLYAVLFVIIGFTNILVIFSVFGVIYLFLYLTIYIETFGKTLVQVQLESENKGYKNIK
jgi:hypothetical protein